MNVKVDLLLVKSYALQSKITVDVYRCVVRNLGDLTNNQLTIIRDLVMDKMGS